MRFTKKWESAFLNVTLSIIHNLYGQVVIDLSSHRPLCTYPVTNPNLLADISSPDFLPSSNSYSRNNHVVEYVPNV
ncbi:hypothetical protein EDB81DRAFT_783545, partial [Dactylonectria macrodidyma]